MAFKQLDPPTLEESYWPPPQGEWTYEDYARLPDNGFRYEVIHGELYMSPASSVNHQRTVTAFIHHLTNYLIQHPVGECIPSPIDIILPDLASPVQPDVVFISNENRDIIKDNVIEGVPSLVIEILSPGTARYDRRTKFETYAEAGIREYWLADPHSFTIEVYVLRGQAYALLGKFNREAQAHSELLPGFILPVKEVFRF
jgi:Uma2 family endonuclease